MRRRRTRRRVTWRMDEDESTVQTNGMVRCRDMRLRLSSPAFSHCALLTSARFMQVPAPAMTQHKEKKTVEPRKYSEIKETEPSSDSAEGKHCHEQL